MLCEKEIMANLVRRRPRKTNPIAGWMGRDEAGPAAGAAGRGDRGKRTQFADRGTGLPARRPELGSFVRRGCSRGGKTAKMVADGTCAASFDKENR